MNTTQNQNGNSELNSELKPCPFCGGLASIYFDPEGTRDTVGRHWAYTVVCDRCCATSGLMFSKEMAAEVWNRRATDEN
jgi:Lar family restriction alleviation protein